jgi:hypothetical protein
LSTIPLTLGPLDAPGHEIRRSGFRWAREDGETCRAGEIVAYCNLAVVPEAGGLDAASPFRDEARDLQVALVARVRGRLRRNAGTSLGGHLDRLADRDVWDASQAIGELDPDPAVEGALGPRDEPFELLFGAGRRVAELAEERSGFLTGWHDRVRAWWGDGARATSLLGLGICEQQGVFRGDHEAFRDWFDAAAGPAEILLVPDHVLVPCAVLVAEQMRRTPAEASDIRADAWASLASLSGALAASDWVFAGTLIGALLRSPVTERRDRLSRSGLASTATLDAVLLSLNSEPVRILRHRRLGYTLTLHGYRVQEAGPGIRRWLDQDFERVERTPADIARDLGALADALRARSGATVLVLNVMSSSGHEEIVDYSAFDRPLGRTLASVHAKDMNLMLHDAARDHGLAIVDSDAIAASMGATHLPDGVHGSGAMEAEVRAEIVRILRARGLPGFAPRPAR